VPRRSGLVLVGIGALTLSACGGATRPASRSVPAIAVVAERPALREVPYDQPFAFVDAAVLFAGIAARDSSALHLEGARQVRETVAIPLTTLGWYEVDTARARYRVAVLFVDGPSRQWQQRFDGQWTRLGGSCWTLMTVGALHRGFAIERVSDGAIFSRVHRGGVFDAATADDYLGKELMKLVLMQQPDPDVEVRTRPPANARYCGDAPTTRDQTPTSRPPPVVAPPTPTAPSAPRRPNAL